MTKIVKDNSINILKSTKGLTIDTTNIDYDALWNTWNSLSTSGAITNKTTSSSISTASNLGTWTTKANPTSTITFNEHNIFDDYVKKEDIDDLVDDLNAQLNELLKYIQQLEATLLEHEILLKK